MAQAVNRSPPTAGVTGSRVGRSMWISWGTNQNLGRFFSGFLPFFLVTNFIPPFLRAHLIHFVSFQFIHPNCDASRMVGRHPRYSQTLEYRGFLASHPSIWSYVGYDLNYM